MCSKLTHYFYLVIVLLNNASCFSRDDSVVMKTVMTVDDMIGYIKTWSSYQTFLKECPDRSDFLSAFRQRYAKCHFFIFNFLSVFIDSKKLEPRCFYSYLSGTLVLNQNVCSCIITIGIFSAMYIIVGVVESHQCLLCAPDSPPGKKKQVL